MDSSVTSRLGESRLYSHKQKHGSLKLIVKCDPSSHRGCFSAQAVCSGQQQALRQKEVSGGSKTEHSTFTKCSLICRNNIFSKRRGKRKKENTLGVLVAGQEETLEEQAGQAVHLRPCAPRRHSKARRSGPTASGEACRPPNTGSSTNTRQLIT